MKKQLLFLFTIIILAGYAFPGTIRVTSPAAGTAWEKDQTHTISWSSTGCTDPGIKINVFRNSIAEANFIEQLTCSGCSSYSWHIPAGYADGNYVLRIKTADNACFGDSGVFAIGAGAASRTGSIHITSPHTGDTWLRGSSHQITWTSSGSLDPNLKINIFRNSISEANFVEQLTATTASGSKVWNIPGTYEAGNYYIRIKTDDSAVTADSGRFEISATAVIQPFVLHLIKPHMIQVVEPNGGRSLALGSTIRILWRAQNLTNDIKISLMKNGELFGVIAENLAPGRISHDWRIGETLIKTAVPDSGFKIKVEEQGINVSDQSDRPFSIEAARHVDLSCYVASHRSADHGKVARITAKIRVNNIGTEILRNVLVRMTVRDPGASSGETKEMRIPELTYRGSSYEYSLEFNFRLHEGNSNRDVRQQAREAVVVVDPDDLFRDVRLMNNTSTYTFVF
jgi:hypothetical protein